jgi:hypothetical protein
MLAENVIGLTPAARIARAIEIARARQAAYKPAANASENHRRKKNGTA